MKKWNQRESDVLDSLLSAFGKLKSLSDDEKIKLHPYAYSFFKSAFDIKEKSEPKGMVV